ncbi:hypothetical protein A3768_4077 (plasmid) [Ralstonia solanacearum]|nr:hypothetical protein A3768_4077 [Ralstonia solanacearum]
MPNFRAEMDEKFFYIGFFCMADANDQIDLGDAGASWPAIPHPF